MKREFVKTENAQRLATAIHLREARGAAESGLVVVHGRAGEGKTRTLHNWASTRRAVMLTAYPGWTPGKMMAEIAQVLHVVTRGTWEADIAEHIAEAETPLVVDEAGFALANSAACLERLRTITDKSGTLLVMALMQRDMARLCQYDQLTSRATLCEFKQSSVSDVGAACAQLAEVTIAGDLVERIHAEAEGRMRLVIDAIHLVENVARSKGLARVAAADLAGMRLCQDFDAAGTGGSRHRSASTRRGGR